MTTTSNRLAAVADAAGMTSIPDHEPSAWLRDRLTDLRRRYLAGQLRHCGHVTPWGQAIAPLWADTLTCGPCARLNRLTGEDDMRCDRCAIVCTGVIHPVVLAFGPLLVTGGLCPSCKRREVVA
jgi:hypothetical protein